MVKDPGKLRLWRIAELVYKQTDETHMLSAAQINRILSEQYGLSSNARTIQEDIRFLREAGMGIETVRSTQNRYYVSHRLFELPELQLLIDAVESSRFVTEKKSKALTDKLLTLTSVGGVEQLRHHFVTTPDRKPENEQIYYIADTVSRAFRLKKKIRFQYYQYDAYKNKVLKRDGEPQKRFPCSIDLILEEDAVPPPEGFSPRWHPPREKERFCAQGRMLFLSLYEASTRKPTRKMLYERCHEMIDLVMAKLS